MFCGTVSACWLGVCREGCQLSPCRILYIIVNLDSGSLAVCLWCSGTANSVFGSLQLDYCGAARLCTDILRFVDVLLGSGVPDDRSVFKCCLTKV